MNINHPSGSPHTWCVPSPTSFVVVLQTSKTLPHSTLPHWNLIHHHQTRHHTIPRNLQSSSNIHQIYSTVCCVFGCCTMEFDHDTTHTGQICWSRPQHQIRTAHHHKENIYRHLTRLGNRYNSVFNHDVLTVATKRWFNGSYAPIATIWSFWFYGMNWVKKSENKKNVISL